MRRIAIINQKGGVGKTTTAANLGAALARAGQRVLVVDLDPQANLSMYLGVETTPEEPSSYGVLCSGTPVGMAVRTTSTPGLQLLPAHIDLSGAELELASTFGRETLLRDALDRWLGEEAAEGRALDIVLFDCPPSLGLLSINGLCAANEVLVVAQTEFFALQGLSKLLGVIELVKQRLNPELNLTGVLAALYDSRLRLAREVLGELRRYFPDETFQTTIGTNVRLAESPSHGQTIFEYAPESRGAQDYAALAEELIAGGNPTAPDGGDLRDKADDLAHADAALRKRERDLKDPEPALPATTDSATDAVAPAEPAVESTPTALASKPTASAASTSPGVESESAAATCAAVAAPPSASEEWLVLHEPVAVVEEPVDTLETPATDPALEDVAAEGSEEQRVNDEAAATAAEVEAPALDPTPSAEPEAPAVLTASTDQSTELEAFGAGVLEASTEAAILAVEAPPAMDEPATQADAEVEPCAEALLTEDPAAAVEADAGCPAAETSSSANEPEAAPLPAESAPRQLPSFGWGDYLGEERSRPVWPQRRQA